MIVGLVILTAVELLVVRWLLRRERNIGYHEGQVEATWCDVDYDLAFKDGYQHACGDFVRDVDDVVDEAEQITREASTR